MLLPGIMFVSSSHESAPESVESAKTAWKIASIDPHPAALPVGESGAALDSEPELITLGSHDELDGLLAEAAAEPQAVASIAPRDAPEAVQPAQERRQLPLYLMADETAEGHAGSGPALEDRYDCIIEPFELVEVGSALTAVVESVAVERSDFVAAGQVLARLEASPERATVAAARARAGMDGDVLARRARMELGGRKRNRADQLFESEALSVDMRDEIETEAKVAKAVLQEAREHKELMELEHQEAVERLKEHTIRSPVSGVVVERLKSPGEVVKEETIVVLAQIDPLRVEVILPAAVFGAVEAGMRAEVMPELPNAGVQVASVTIVDRVVDATSGTFGVRLELPNADHAVPSGLRCRARFLQVD
jgi:RND family efflux transporter MFP subunit